MPKLFNRGNGLPWLWLSVVVFALDQLTKWLTVQQLALYESVTVTPFFNLVYVRNYGAAFSFLSDAGGWQRWMFTLIAVAVSLLLIVWMQRTPRAHRVLNSAYALILGGAIGNVLDRMLHGYVIDFLDFHLANTHWPAFNIADSAICVGAVLLIIDSLFLEKRRQHRL